MEGCTALVPLSLVLKPRSTIVLAETISRIVPKKELKGEDKEWQFTPVILAMYTAERLMVKMRTFAE